MICSLPQDSSIPVKVGFSEFPFFDNFQNIDRSLLVWYPIEANNQVTPSKNLWDLFDLGIDAPVKQNRLKMPLIAISHGWSGDPHELSWLIKELIKEHFLVIGIQHRDFIDRKMHINHWKRAQDISLCIDQFISTPFAKFVDLEKIGIAGFSLGGTTALWLSGAKATKLVTLMPEPEYADPSNFSDVDELLPFLDKEMMSKDWKDSRINASFIMAPAWAWIFNEKSLEIITTPTYIVACESDEVVKTAYNAKLFAKHIPSSTYQEIEGEAGHYIFSTKLMGQKRNIVDPDEKLNFLFDDHKSVDRLSLQNQVAEKAILFFSKHLI